MLGSVLLPDGPRPPLSPGHECLGCAPAALPHPIHIAFEKFQLQYCPAFGHWWCSVLSHQDLTDTLSRPQQQPFGKRAQGLCSPPLVKPVFASKAGQLVHWISESVGITFALRCKKLLKKLGASEVWVVCPGNPVVNKRSSQMGFHRINAKQTSVTVTLLA